MHGFDPVSYFSDKPEKGIDSIRYKYKGIIYLFANTGNRKLFIQSPEKYEPVYGGWCAFAMGKSGKKVDIDPLTFKIIHGRLYLFYNKFLNNTLDSWNKNEDPLRKSADRNWNKILTSQ